CPTNEESTADFFAASRVAPTKIMTIPWLELEACLFLSKFTTHKVIRLYCGRILINARVD
ncbi:hypothetical protein AVEN_68475-1, partial [Araneus ventricosus]